jgi:predicted 3-demethylubiquinone-9 3-methyltransferase (glyoxalase superfamily)
MSKVTTFLWFNDRAEEAARFYVSLFKNADIESMMPGPGGKPMGVTFSIDGQRYIAFNGGPHYQLSAAVSLFIDCADQAEVDKYWDALIADGGRPDRCGWLVDKFGLSWQVIPKALTKMLSDPDRPAAGRATQAMLKMQKIDVAEMQRAFDGDVVAA